MRVLKSIGVMMLACVKLLLKLILGMLRVGVEIVKLFLLLLNMILRIFLSIIGGTTPWCN